MAEFIVTGPDGKEYHVTGDNAEGAVAAVKKMVGSVVPGMKGADAMRARGLTSPDPSGANAQAAADMQGAQDEAYVQDNPIGSRVNAFNAGLPFIGEWTDEAMGSLGGASAEQLRAGQEAFSRARPGQDAALRFGGAVTGSIPLAIAGAPLAGALAPEALGLRTIATGLGGSLTGAAEGAVSGAGRDDENRMRGMKSGALVGGALGLGAGIAAPIIGKGVQNLAGYLKGSDVATIASSLGISPAAARAVKAALAGDDLGAAGARLARGGPDAMLVEAGPSTQSLGKGVAASGGEATRIMREGVEDRATRASAQVEGALDTAMGKPSGRHDLASGIRAATKKVRGEAYGKAYDAPIDYAAPAGRRIEDILTRAPAKTVEAAVRKANERMRYDGITNKQVMASIGKDGKVTFSEMPNAMQLDYIKRGFDEVAEDGKDVAGKLSSDGAFAARVAKDLRNAHAAANPAYREALRTGLDTIQSEKAVETGYKAMTSATTVEDLRKGLAGLNNDARSAAKLGARQYIDDAVANVKAIMSRPGMDADVGEAMKVVKDLSSRANQQKLAMLVGKDQAEKLLGKLDETKTAFEIQAALSRNSDTAVNQAVQASVEKSATPTAVGKLLAGEPIQATKRLTQIFTGRTPEAQEAAKAGIYTEIAGALTRTRGGQAQAALKLINGAMQGQKMSETEAKRLAYLVTSALAGGGYQTGKQALQNR